MKMKRIIPFILAVVMLLGTLVSCGNSVTKLLSKGQYEKAYKKAKESEKYDIKAESIAAECAKTTYNTVINEFSSDPGSFKVLEAYYKEHYEDFDEKYLEGASLCLLVSAKNNIGVIIKTYMRYYYDRDLGQWDFLGMIWGDLDDDEYFTEAEDNLARFDVLTLQNSDSKLSKDSVKRINALIENGKIDKVKAIDVQVKS